MKKLKKKRKYKGGKIVRKKWSKKTAVKDFVKLFENEEKTRVLKKKVKKLIYKFSNLI